MSGFINKEQLQRYTNGLKEKFALKTDVVQADWNENDITSKSHVLHRTHWEIPATVIMNKTFPAPGDATVFFNLDTPLIAGELYTVAIQGLSSGFDTTEEIVAAGDSDGAYLSNSKGLEIGYSATGFSSGYNAYYTGIGANYGEVVTITKSGELHQLDEKFIPNTIARVANLPQADWNQNDSEAADYIKNRICYSETTGSPYKNGDTDVSVEVNLGQAVTFKYDVYDYLESTDEILGRTLTLSVMGQTMELNIDDSVIYAETNGSFLIVQSGNELPFAANIKDSSFQYYQLFGRTGLFIVSGMTNPSQADYEYELSVQETIHKIDDKYLPKQAARVGYGLNSVEESSGHAFGAYSHAEGMNNVYDAPELTYSSTNTYTTDYKVREELINCYAFYDGKYYQITDIQYDDVNDVSTITFDGLDVNDTIEVTIFSGASGDYSHAEGHNVIANGRNSHSEGDNTTASGYSSHAEGDNTTASGYSSHTEGSYTTASGYSSHAEGSYTTASEDYSHAEGDNTTASGYSSHAEGSYTTASGDSSHTEGSHTTASSSYSHAEGYNTIAASGSQHVFGRYNVEDNYKTGIPEWVSGTSYQVGDKVIYNDNLYQCKIANNNTVFVSSRWDNKGNLGAYAEIVGNGTNTQRSNARTLDWQGNEVIAGTLSCSGVSVNGTPITPTQAMSQAQVTEFINNL